MQSKNKDSATLRNEASELRDAARAKLDEHLSTLKSNLEEGHHNVLEGEVQVMMSRHNESGESLKGPNGLAAQAKKSTEHLAKLGNQKNILRFLKLHAAHDKLTARLEKQTNDTAVAQAAKRVYDLLGR